MLLSYASTNQSGARAKAIRNHELTMRTLPLLLILVHRRLLLAAFAVDQFTFNGFDGENLTLDGTAAVTTDGHLMLTNGTTWLKGHAFYPSPLPFHGTESGSTSSPRFRVVSAAYVFYGVLDSVKVSRCLIVRYLEYDRRKYKSMRSISREHTP
jgi:hypothetical protein